MPSYLCRVERSLGEKCSPAGEILSWDHFKWGVQTEAGKVGSQTRLLLEEAMPIFKSWAQDAPCRTEGASQGSWRRGQQNEWQASQQPTKAESGSAPACACVAFELPTDCHRENQEGGREMQRKQQ